MGGCIARSVAESHPAALDVEAEVQAESVGKARQSRHGRLMVTRLQPGDVRLAHAKLLGELRLGKAMADPVPDYFDSDVVGELRSLVLAPVLRILHRLLVLGVRAHRLRKLCHGLHPSSFPSSRYFS